MAFNIRVERLYHFPIKPNQQIYSLEYVFVYKISIIYYDRYNSIENRDEKIVQLERLQLFGEKVLSLNDKDVKTYSKQLKNTNSPETILAIFEIN